MNTHRVFLHDLLWEQDSIGFMDRIDKFLEISDRNGIKTLLVFFDEYIVSWWSQKRMLGLVYYNKEVHWGMLFII